VSLDYFKTLGVRLLSGRDFTTADVAGRPQVVIINDAMARRFWPDKNPLGQRLARQGNPPIWLEVVGVVDDIRFPGSLSEPYTHLQAFRPIAQAAVPNVNITLRASSNPQSLADAARRVVAELDSTLPLSRLRSARSIVDRGMGNISLLGALLGAFAMLGLILAAIGIYGVTSYSVLERTGEIGIRTALGAQAPDLIRLVVGKVAALVVSGAIVGLGGAYVVSRLMIAGIPALPTWDPLAVVGVTVASILVALAACYLPARRATRVNPIVALRHE
jgi:putative ABC transport system permease protein